MVYTQSTYSSGRHGNPFSADVYTSEASVAFRLVSGTYSERRVISARAKKNLWQREKRCAMLCSPTGDLSIIGLCRVHHARGKRKANSIQPASSGYIRRPIQQSIAIMSHLKLRTRPTTCWDPGGSQEAKRSQTYIDAIQRKEKKKKALVSFPFSSSYFFSLPIASPISF